jgi:hypothetical protein
MAGQSSVGSSGFSFSTSICRTIALWKLGDGGISLTWDRSDTMARSRVQSTFRVGVTDGKVDLAEIVRKKDQDVAMKVKVLRAGGLVDRERWLKRVAYLLHQKNFADALFCFKKANDPRGIAHSQAWLYEQEGRSRRAVNDLEGSTASYEKAIVLFMQLELFDASACYQAIERYDKAVGMAFVDPTCNSLNTNVEMPRKTELKSERDPEGKKS